MKKSLHEILAPFSLGQINDLMNLAETLSANGYNPGASLRRYYDQQLQNRILEMRAGEAGRDALHASFVANSPACPDCGKTLRLIELNSHPWNMVPGDANSMWQCPDMMGCGYEKESKNLPENEYRHYAYGGAGVPITMPPVVDVTAQATQSARYALKRGSRAAKRKSCGGCR